MLTLLRVAAAVGVVDQRYAALDSGRDVVDDHQPDPIAAVVARQGQRVVGFLQVGRVAIDQRGSSRAGHK